MVTVLNSNSNNNLIVSFFHFFAGETGTPKIFFCGRGIMLTNIEIRNLPYALIALEK